jgi:hypothetical protein
MRLIQLKDLQNRHLGEDFIVCGCGRSLLLFQDPGSYNTIGVNDVGRYFVPDYLIVVNPESSFKRDRWEYIRKTNPPYFLSQYKLKVLAQNYVQFQLGGFGKADFSNPNVLNYTQNSPYVAIDLAAHLGAKKIGLYGLDFTEDHFFGKTGRHVLSSQLDEINRQFKRLDEGCRAMGVEIINLSPESRITAFRKGSIEEIRKKTGERPEVNASTVLKKPKIFFVHYKFLSCGEVFRDGLSHAAEDLQVEYAETYWDDPELPRKVKPFSPDLLFVVHGRMFSKKWGSRFKNYRTAVWLLDEPYEVDDTSQFSGIFDTVYVNDPGTIHRHKNAYYLPVCYDPHVYFDAPGPGKYEVGFIGGYNTLRQKILEKLYHEGLLSYVVGGPWQGEYLNKICLSKNIPAHETAELYRQTRIVINIFREAHHFNRQKIPAFSMNPRVYEALACGALVVSENREEIKQVFPDMPVFGNGDEIVEVVREFLKDRARYDRVRIACLQNLKGHTFTDRLRQVMSLSLGEKMEKPDTLMTQSEINMVMHSTELELKSVKIYEEWKSYGDVTSVHEDGIVTFRKTPDSGPGTERGWVSKRSYMNQELSFEVHIKSGSCFIAKIHQVDPIDQTTNSYHLMCEATRSYFAKHHHIFKTLPLGRNVWEKIKILYHEGMIAFYRNDKLVFTIKDPELKQGYAFLGIKSGEASVRNIHLRELNVDPRIVGNEEGQNYEVLHSVSQLHKPVVSIITTVYDRVECIRRCIKSVKSSIYKNYEHIIVSDSPPEGVVEAIRQVVRQEDDSKIAYANLKERFNNWGIAPASVGLKLSRGKYVCFLSDDNGYTPDHIGNLVTVLEEDPKVGFAYSSCRYDGRLILSSPVPRPARIDLGQPMFRRELFDLYLNGTLPFNMLAWDWYMIDAFMKNGVRWRHVNKPTFLFRLAKYSQFMVK